MDERTQEWRSRKWCVAVCDSPTNGHVEQRRSVVGAYWTAWVYRMAGWHVQVFRVGSHAAEDMLKELQAKMTRRTP